MKEAGLKKSEGAEFENEIYQSNDLSKSERDQRENLNSSAEIFEKSKEGKIENLKEAGLKKSEQSEFEN